MTRPLKIIGILLAWAFLLIIAGCSSPPTEKKEASIQELDKSKKTAITVALKHDKELAGENIRVKVVNFVATLNGTVSSDEAKQRAEKIARGVPGIKEVENKLKVRK
ncbi:MAG: BON domain-containing protein [Candidatus Eremiobacteraeota bacterium]|nr:BON domain-containing protein [Candidatus Eremiobacteraeota bacterium]